MALLIKKLGGLLGGRVEGVDFSTALTEQTIEAIADALYEHQVISIPATEMTLEQHLQIALRFGEPEHNATDQFQRDENAKYLTVIDSDKGDRADSWHADETFLEHPPLVNLLHAKIIPDCGGDTAFRSAAASYEGLSDKIKQLLEGLTAVHDYGHLYELGWQSGIPLGEMVGDALVKGLIHSHPIVKTHPVTGRQWLTVNATYTRFVQGLNPIEGKMLLEMLLQQMQKPEFNYRHHWQNGDLLIWDQQAVQHYAVGDFSGRRLMNRISALACKDSYRGVTDK
ncbi:MAG: TauD/TfdA dioxygenase family protein [Pseudomonadales bacterium]